MIQIILLILGVVYFFKRPKLANLSASDFPDIPTDKFEEWRRLEVQSIDAFLLATWGLAILGFVIGFLLAGAAPGATGPFTTGYFVVFLIGLSVSAILGSKAAKLKKSVGIVWPQPTK